VTPLFRRGERLHERLAREGGLSGDPAPHDPRPRWGEVGIHGVARPREWDAVATADAADLPGDTVEFVALADGSLILDDELDADAVEPLLAVLDGAIEPPYRAEAVLRGGTMWAVGARRIEVVELPDDVGGDELELSVSGGERTLVVDGFPGFGSVPALERLGAARYESFAARARRLDGNLWDVQVSPL